MSKGGFQNPKYAQQPTGPGTVPPGQGGTTPTYGGGFGAGTYDPMLGFGQASGMGTTYNYPTRYSADYTRYAQSGQPFNPAVMGYNSYGQIFAQPRRQQPPPTMGKGGGGFRPQPPTMGRKGQYDPNRRMGSPGFGFPGGGPSIFEPGYGPGPMQPAVMPEYAYPTNQVSQYAIGPTPPREVLFDDREVRSREQRSGPGYGPPVSSGGTGGFLKTIQTPPNEPPTYPGGGQSLPPDISGSPFGPLIGGGGLGGMSGGLQLSPDDPMYGMPSAPPSMPVMEPGLDVGQAFNTYQREMQDWQNKTGMTADQWYSKRDQGIDFQNKQAASMPAAPPPEAQAQAVASTPGYFGSMGNLLGSNFGNMGFFQEGGQVPPDAAANMEMMLSEAGPANPQSEMAGEYDRLIQMTMQAVLGQVENPDEIIKMFIDEFGTDAFRQLRDAVLKQQVPNAQTEGMVDGNGGGMDDQVMGMIGNQRPVAVSPGEYIVPADVVSGLGDGSSKSGADILDELNQAVRMARTGTPEQPRPLMETLQ